MCRVWYLTVNLLKQGRCIKRCWNGGQMTAVVFEGQSQVMGTVMTDLPVPAIHTVSLGGNWEYILMNKV